MNLLETHIKGLARMFGKVENGVLTRAKKKEQIRCPLCGCSRSEGEKGVRREVWPSLAGQGGQTGR